MEKSNGGIGRNDTVHSPEIQRRQIEELDTALRTAVTGGALDPLPEGIVQLAHRLAKKLKDDVSVASVAVPSIPVDDVEYDYSFK